MEDKKKADEERRTRLKAELDELEKEKSLLMGEIVGRRDNPSTLAGLFYNRFLYNDHPYGHPVSGTEKTVISISRQDVINSFQNNYIPNNSVLIVVGDINTNKVNQMIEARLNS